MAAVFRLQNNAILKRVVQPVLANVRAISTSKKNSDTVTTAVNEQVSACDAKTSEKNWVSYGFDFKDQAEDKRATHSIFFFAITVCVIFGGFIWAYIPDYQLRDWAQREAFLELRRREKAGLPLVDANLIDPAKVQLPDDEDLGETEIII